MEVGKKEGRRGRGYLGVSGGGGVEVVEAGSGWRARVGRGGEEGVGDRKKAEHRFVLCVYLRGLS